MQIHPLTGKELSTIKHKLPSKWNEQPFFICLDQFAVGRYLCTDDRQFPIKGPEYTNVYFAPPGLSNFGKVACIRNVLKASLPNGTMDSPAKGEIGVWARGYWILSSGTDGSMRMKTNLEKEWRENHKGLTEALRREKNKSYVQEREAKKRGFSVKQELAEARERSSAIGQPLNTQDKGKNKYDRFNRGGEEF